jgi:hypothetical protein
MAKIDAETNSQYSQASVSGVKEPVFIRIILRIYPFFLELSPYCFRNIQVWRIRKKVSDEQPPLLPERYPYHSTAGFVNAGIIQYQYGFLFNAENYQLFFVQTYEIFYINKVGLT